jgi:murein DD-endopeptidase MepM/ murein hydrolase activator NlpD
MALAGCATTPPTTPIATVHPADGITHRVQSGETLWRIAKAYDINLNSLLKANALSETSTIEKGQLLFIPGARKRKEVLRHTFVKDAFRWPVNGSLISSYGAKTGGVKNKGIDIRANAGASIRASRDGKVVFCDNQFKGFGKTLIIDHGDGYRTVYAYNSDILVRVGDVVKQDDIIAKAGRSGRATEPSLHFEIRRGGEPQNPLHYLPH